MNYLRHMHMHIHALSHETFLFKGVVIKQPWNLALVECCSQRTWKFLSTHKYTFYLVV